MRIGLTVGFSEREPRAFLERARRAEALGYDSVWTGEAYGSDAVVPLAAVAAITERIRIGSSILQMPARTAATTAMTAATLDGLSGGRFVLGLGLSGPQVVEGWHGRAYTAPLATTREYVDALRRLFARQAPLELHGSTLDIPYRGPDSTGLGKPLKLMVHPRPDIPIYLAAIGPRNIALATEIADGILPIFFSPTNWRAGFGEVLADARPGFEVAASAWVVVGDDIDACRDKVRPFLALYVGGMGARGRNFYNALVCRLGFEGAAGAIQDFYLDGKTREAAAAVPDALVDEVALCGPPARIADRLAAWKESPVTTLIVSSPSVRTMELMAELTG